MIDKYRYWLWVLYPVGLVVMMLISVRILFSTDTNKLVEANLKRKQAVSDAIKVANLKTKLSYLNGIDQTQYIDDLKLLLTAVPASKKPWLTLAEMNLAASRSGIAVSDFFGSIGEIKEASQAAEGLPLELYIESEVRVDDFSVLRTFFKELYKLRPLVKVLSLEWKDKAVEMRIDVSFSPWPKLVTDVEGIVAENKDERVKLMEKIKEFEDVDPLVEYSATESGNMGIEVSPF